MHSKGSLVEMQYTASDLKVSVAHTLRTLLLRLTESLLSHPSWHILCPAVLVFTFGYPAMYSLWMSPSLMLLDSHSGAQWLKHTQLMNVAQPKCGGADLVCRWLEVESGTNANAMSKRFMLELMAVQERVVYGFQRDQSVSFAGVEAFRLKNEEKPITIFVESPLEPWGSSRRALEADNNTFRTIQRQGVNRKLYSGVRYSDGLVRSAKAAFILIWSRKSDDVVVGSRIRQNIVQARLESANMVAGEATDSSFAVEFSRCTLFERVVVTILPFVTAVYYYVAFSRLGSLKSRPGLVVAHVVELILSEYAAGTVTCIHSGLKFDILQLPMAVFLCVPVLVSLSNTFRLVRAVRDTPEECNFPLRVHQALLESVPASAMLVIEVCLVSLAEIKLTGSNLGRQVAIFTLASCLFDFFLHVTYFATCLTIDVRKLELQDVLQKSVSSPDANRRHLGTFQGLWTAVGVLACFLWMGTWTRTGNLAASGQIPAAVLGQALGNGRFFANMVSQISGKPIGTVSVGLAPESGLLRLGTGSRESGVANSGLLPTIFRFNVSYFVEYGAFVIFVACMAYVGLKIALSSEPAVLDMQQMGDTGMEEKEEGKERKERGKGEAAKTPRAHVTGDVIGSLATQPTAKSSGSAAYESTGLKKRRQRKFQHSASSIGDKARFFKCKELSRGHFLDVAAVATSSCPFVTSVGLDNKILVWSPLVRPIPVPTQLPMSVKLLPVKKVVMSPSGSLIAVFCRGGVVKCWSRLAMAWIWTIHSQGLEAEMPLEAFFRTRHVPGARSRGGRRRMGRIERRGDAERSRDTQTSLSGERGGATQASSATPSNSSPTSQTNQSTTSPHINVFPHPPSNRPLSLDSRFDSSTNLRLLSRNSHRDFVIVLSTGILLTVDCVTGNTEKQAVMDGLGPESAARLAPGARIICCTALCTPRMSDRLVFALSDGSLLVLVATGTRWRAHVVNVHRGYNSGDNSPPSHLSDHTSHLQTPVVLAPVPFVGMVVRACHLQAQLIDVQSGTVLREGPIGQFRPDSFRVFHPEPSHCRFCGCASVRSFTLAYTELETGTLIVHTFTIDNRAKNSICLRVDRDPRETRCLGFASVSEHQHWLRHVAGWLPTDLDSILGIRRRSRPAGRSSTALDGPFWHLLPGGHPAAATGGHQATSHRWEGFTMSADGAVSFYDIPEGAQPGLAAKSVGPLAKFGHKSIVAAFGNVLKVLYLGNDNLIEENNDDRDSCLGGVTSNSLSFINRRRRMRLRRYRLTHSTNFNDSMPSSAASSDTEQ